MSSRVVCVGFADERLQERLAHLHPVAEAYEQQAVMRLLEGGGVELLLVAAGYREGRRLITEVRRGWPELAVLYVGGQDEAQALRSETARPPRLDGGSLLEILPVLLAFPPTLLRTEIENVVRLAQCLSSRPPWKFPEETASLLAGFMPASAWVFLRLQPPHSRLQALIVDALPEETICNLRQRVLRVIADPQFDELIACELWGAPLMEMEERRALMFLAEPLECDGETLGAIGICGRRDALDSPLQAHMLKLLASVFARHGLPGSESCDERMQPPLRALCQELGDVSQPSDAVVQLCRAVQQQPLVEHCGFAVWLAGRELCAAFPTTASLADSMAFNDALVERFRELFALEESGAEVPNDAPQRSEGLVLLPLWVGGRFLGVVGVRGLEHCAFDLPTAVDMTCLALEGLLLKGTLEARDAERRDLSKLKHEINNALTVVIGNTQLMLFRAHGDDAEMLRQVEECAVRIRDVATRLGELSRS